MQYLGNILTIEKNNFSLAKTTGVFYTHRLIASHFISAILEKIGNNFKANSTIKITDPFAGDGRLISWFLEEWNLRRLPSINWEVVLWDISSSGFQIAEDNFQNLRNSGVLIDVQYHEMDSFLIDSQHYNTFDLILSNPPWKLLKPDKEESLLAGGNLSNYIGDLRSYDTFLGTKYPESQPKEKFAGWGTNLSRVGLSLCEKLCKTGGYIGIVLPASFLADGQSSALRKLIIVDNEILDIGYFPAETRLFDKADVDSISLVLRKNRCKEFRPRFVKYDRERNKIDPTILHIPSSFLEQSDFILPISFGSEALDLLIRFAANMGTWGDLEKKSNKLLWAGREVDETGISRFLTSDEKGLKFVKGKMIDRYRIVERPLAVFQKANWNPPISSQYTRIGWRDISRSSQKRRMIATIIPQNHVAGNSIGITYLLNQNDIALKSLLGIMNSFVFEFQLRFHLATSHVSLSSLRKVFIPEQIVRTGFVELARLVDQILEGNIDAEYSAEALVAKEIYGLNREEFMRMIKLFGKVSELELNLLIVHYDRLENIDKAIA